MSPASTEQFLLEQYTGHPASQLQDLRKALYQSVFGCEHLITDSDGIRRTPTSASRLHIRRSPSWKRRWT